MSLHKYRNKPIPTFASEEAMLQAKGGYRQYALDITHALQQEGFCDVRDAGIAGDNYYWRESGNPPYNQRMEGSISHLRLRKSMVEKLIRINQKLAAENLELYVLDAWRPIALQYYARQQCMKDIRESHPDWLEKEVIHEADKYRADSPATEAELNISSPPPHSTGAALDCMIRYKDTHEFLDMGTAFDVLTQDSRTDHYEKYGNSVRDKTIIENRRLKYRLFAEEGCVTNPTEHRHHSRGDQMRAKLRQEETAYYSLMDVTDAS